MVSGPILLDGACFFVLLDGKSKIRHSEVMLSIFIFLFSAHLRAATVVTQTVGQVSDHVITSREVQIAAVIEGVLFPLKNAPKGLVQVLPDQVAFRGAVTSVLLDTVVSLEAESFNVAVASEADLGEALSRIERAVSGNDYWQSLEVSGSELRKFTLRKLTAKSFLSFKTNSMSGIITDQEALEYYDKNRLKFGGLPFASFKANIKSFLSQQQLEDRLRAWFEVIKHKYKVRNFLADSL
jgi:hypothetical protein